VISLAGPQPDNEAQAEARAALRQDDGFYSSPMATGTMPAKTGATSQPRSWTAGMEAPKLPLTAAQQQQLDQLLQQYRANQISSSEYHTKRAEIIANK